MSVYTPSSVPRVSGVARSLSQLSSTMYRPEMVTPERTRSSSQDAK